MRLHQALALACSGAAAAAALSFGPSLLEPLSSPSQTIAKRGPFPAHTYPPPAWDNASLFLLGERTMLFSGEFHPFRLPVPSLWWDVLEKMKAAGLNTVSFYVDWALVEGKPGEFWAEGVFDLAEFFDAAKELGLWLVARPGPYISMLLFYFLSDIRETLCADEGH
jgi:hypothetical protein